MISAPAAQIASALSESSHIIVDGEERPNYGNVQAGMMSIIFILLAIWVSLGVEHRGSHFELVKAAGEGDGSTKADKLEEGVMSDENEEDLSSHAAVELEEVAKK